MEIDLKNFGESHPDVATYYDNLGITYNAKGEYDKAIEYYKKALAIDLKNFGENHPQIAIYNNNLGTIYRAKGEYDKAIDYYEKSLKIFIDVFKDENHPNIQTAKRNLEYAKENQNSN